MSDDVRRECKHGQLARSCEVCERDDEIERLRARIKELEDALPRWVYNRETGVLSVSTVGVVECECSGNGWRMSDE